MLLAISNNSDDAIWFLDKNQNYLFVNEIMCKDILNEKDHKETIGKPITHFIKQNLNHAILDICIHYNNLILQNKQPVKARHTLMFNGNEIEIELNKSSFLRFIWRCCWHNWHMRKYV